MFIQVIQGKTSQPDELRTLAESWQNEGRIGSVGYLGGTHGVTDDGDYLGVVRFTSREDAMANSGRPETHAFAEKMGALMEGPVQFHDCGDVTEFLDGGSDDAGFVQIMQGRTSNLARLREVDAMFEERFPDLRPELLGYIVGVHDDEDGAFTLTAFFTSEEAARAGEREEPPPEAAELLQEEMQLMQDVTYVDLREPWLYSPRP